MSKIFFTNKDILDFEDRYRAKFINTLSGFKPINLIGTSDGELDNVAIISSVFHLGSKPPLLGFISRPDSVDRHTLENIRSTGVYTVNHVSAEFYKNAHQTSARYPREVSEFKACNIESEWLDKFKAPFVKQAPIKIGMQLIREQRIPENDTILVIGEIRHVILDDSLISDDGFIDLEKAQIICGSSLDSYHEAKKLARLSYAKPDREPTEI